MQLRRVVKSKMFPHFLAMLQWTLLVISIVFNLHFSVAVTGAVANSGLKVIMLFHLWVLLFPVVLCLMFIRIRKEGIVERGIAGLSMITILFSVLNISLHFVDDFVLLMKATEVVAWSLYNGVFSMSVYKVSTGFLQPIVTVAKTEKESLRNDKTMQECG